jgi:hypothetical protein
MIVLGLVIQRGSMRYSDRYTGLQFWERVVCNYGFEEREEKRHTDAAVW